MSLRKYLFERWPSGSLAATALIGFDLGYGLMSRDFNILTEEERYEQASEILKGTCHAFKP